MGIEKLSQQIELEACQEENDFKAWSLHEKAYKQAKKECFEDDVLPVIKESEAVSFVTGKDHFYKIGLKDGRIFDYYPVKNRLLRCKPAKWYNDGKNILLAIILNAPNQ